MSRLSAFARDAKERVLSTLVQAFLGAFTTVLVGSTFFEDLARFDLNEQVLSSAAVAGLAAVLSLVKAGVAKYKANTLSPASLAKE